nr:diaminobutyrate acetyltransferase [Pueribacillus theae]
MNEEGKLNFREPTENDGAAMYTLVKNSKVLDLNSSYSYLMWGKYFNKTSILAEIDDRVVGFISGFLQPNAPDTLFVWQVVVDESQRGKGLATSLLEKLLYQLDHKDIHYLEATVTPSNIASNNLFKGLAKKLEATCEVSECFLEEQFPDPSHETEWTYRIGPLS